MQNFKVIVFKIPFATGSTASEFICNLKTAFAF